MCSMCLQTRPALPWCERPLRSIEATKASLLKLAWYEYSRGHACCANQAFQLYVELGGWVDHPEKIAMTKEIPLA